MKTATLTYDISIPDYVTDDDLSEFLNFSLQIKSEMSVENPINDMCELHPRFLIIQMRPKR